MKIVKGNMDKGLELYRVGNVIKDYAEELYIVAEVGEQYALISLSTGRAANREDVLFDSEEELEDAYRDSEDQLVFGEHLVDFSNASQE